MKTTQLERFYKCDMKKYEIEKNKEFLIWLKKAVKKGYYCFITLKELQELVDNIVNWYEFKYPEIEPGYFEETEHIDLQKNKKFSDEMSIRQLLLRLPHNQSCLMKCGYRARGWSQYPIRKDNGEVYWKSQIFLRIDRKNVRNTLHGKTPYFLIHADEKTGNVFKDYELKEYLNNKENIKLDKLLKIFNQTYTSELDFTELKECIYDHNCDVELRQKVLQLAALKLLYSKNTVPERGYVRAKKFINEFNKKLDLSLSTKEIDEIMYRSYNEETKKIKSLVKKIL